MAATSQTSTARPVTQYSRGTVLGIWAAAALPMAALAWLIAPALAGPRPGPAHLTELLIGTLTAGLVWQFVLVLILVAREGWGLRWSTLRDALWLRPPATAERSGGRLWLWL